MLWWQWCSGRNTSPIKYFAKQKKSNFEIVKMPQRQPFALKQKRSKSIFVYIAQPLFNMCKEYTTRWCWCSLHKVAHSIYTHTHEAINSTLLVFYCCVYYPDLLLLWFVASSSLSVWFDPYTSSRSLHLDFMAMQKQEQKKTALPCNDVYWCRPHLATIKIAIDIEVPQNQYFIMKFHIVLRNIRIRIRIAHVLHEKSQCIFICLHRVLQQILLIRMQCVIHYSPNIHWIHRFRVLINV